MNIKKTLILLFFSLIILKTFGQVKIPDCMLNYKTGEERYILIIDKSTQKMHVYSNYNPLPIKTYIITTGKSNGRKIFEGDNKTPEGLYFFRKVIAEKNLPKTDDYGIQAFTLNYPNPFDKREGRNGSGIWLHGANDGDKIKIPFNTRGCVVLTNNDLIDISKYIFLNITPLRIYNQIKYTEPKVLIEKKKLLLNQLKTWKSSWENKDIDAYINFYSDSFTQKDMNLSQYRRYKERLNNRYRFIKVILSKVNLYRSENYWVAIFNQLYISDQNYFYSRKIQYWEGLMPKAKIIENYNIALPKINKFRDPSGNFILVSDYQKQLNRKIQTNSQLFSSPQVILSQVSRLNNQLKLNFKTTSINDKFSMIPVLYIKNKDKKEFTTIPGIILKDGIPQSFENSFLLNREDLEIYLPLKQSQQLINMRVYTFDESNSFIQINQFNINK